MADGLANIPEEYPITEFGNPVRMAWGVILIAFATFCILCVASTLWLQYFFFQSSVQMNTLLQVGSGTIGVQAGSSAEQTASDARSLATGTLIRTDRTNTLSQATITFRDPNYDNQLVASVTLMGDTSTRLRQAWQPRFEWTSGYYNIEFEGLNGEMNVIIAEGLQHDIEVSVRESDTEIRILEPGRYQLTGQLGQVMVTNWEGEVLIIGPEDVSARLIPPSHRGVFRTIQDEIVVEPASVNLLTNSTLDVFEPEDYETDNPALPDILRGWDCSTNYEFVNRLPLGDYQNATAPDGLRDSFRLLREGATNNVGTGCRQDFSEPGIDVTGYANVTLRARVYVDSQAISGCGEQASECPLMMRVRFAVPSTDETGEIIYDEDGNIEYEERIWIQGVYSRLDPSSPWPLICDTCLRDHVRVYEDVWYVYESDNLFNIFQPGDEPTHVREVEFYASGHNYEVYVDEIALLATRPLFGPSS